MSTVATQLENKMIDFKNKLKFAQNFEIVCNAQMNRDNYSFTTLGNDNCNLLDKTLFSCGSFAIKKFNIKHFEDMFKICFDKKITNTDWLNVIKALKYVVENISVEGNLNIAYDIADEIINKN